MSAYDFDLYVIGGGSGGVRAARVAAALGVKVALAEDSRLGGTCVIRGCVPKKLMVFASGYRETFGDARAYGWDIPEGLEETFQWTPFRAKLNAELDRLEGVYRRLLDNSGVEIHDARAAISGANEITLSDGRKVTAKTILIATGGHPTRPNIENADLAMVSDDIFHMEHLPKSILIVGGGYIASEFACILNGLGVAVTQFYRGDEILRGFDDEARGLVADTMRADGVDLRVNVNVAEMRAEGDAIWTKDTDGAEKVYDKVLFATGRAPNTPTLGLEAAGIAQGRKGEITVDAYSQTSVPNVYAIGDVTDRVNLTPVAIREGMAFVETVYKDNPTKVDHDLIPSAVFTQPELGTIGLSEEEAAKQEPIEVYATSFKPMQSAFAGRESKVMMKLVVSSANRTVLGCHIVADHAGELIQLAGIAVKMGATKEDFDRTVAVHPTMSEELVTMKEPVRTT